MKKFLMGLVVSLMATMMCTSCICIQKGDEPDVQVSKVTLSSEAETITIGSTVQLSYTVEPTGAKVESAVWSSSADAVATVDQKGVVKGIAEGTATITITVNGKFTKTCAVTVAKDAPAMTGITISSEAETIKVDSTFTLTYTVEPTGAKVESAVWSSSADAVATVDQKGVVKGIAEGTATITITVNGKYTKTCAVTVEKDAPAMTGITISSEAETIKVDSTFTLTYTVEPTGAKVETAVWTSSADAVATVDQNGVVKGIGAGTATITITVNGTFTKTCAVTVFSNEFTASIDGLQDTKTTWETGDKITINGVVYKATPMSDATQAAFTKDDTKDDPTGTFNAFYPSSIQSGTTAGGTLPAEQTYASGKITNLPMFATSTTTSLSFKNICTVLAVKVTSADIATLKAIKVKSDKAMCGAFTVSDDKAVLTDASDASKAVTLVSSDALALDADGITFYIAIPAQEYSFLEVYLSSDGTAFTQMMCTKKKSGLGTIASNSVYPIDYAVNAVQLWAGGPFWATTNIGADASTDYGPYFAWGYTEGCIRNSADDGWVLASDGTTVKQFNTTYFPDRETATYQDAATANWGTGWSVPTDSQLKTLINKDSSGKCSVTYVTTGTKGITITGNESGYTSNSIFLPAAGYGEYFGLWAVGQGLYWSSVEESGSRAYCLNFSPELSYSSIGNNDKHCGYSVRPVRSSL